MRFEATGKTIIFKIIHPAQCNRAFTGNHDEGQAGIGAIFNVVDSGEEMADFIRRNQRALVDRFTGPRRVRSRSAVRGAGGLAFR